MAVDALFSGHIDIYSAIQTASSFGKRLLGGVDVADGKREVVKESSGLLAKSR